MATVAFTWELGGGYGHLARFLPVAKRLISHGHRIVLIVQDLRKAGQVYQEVEVRLFQAPVWVRGGDRRDPNPATFAHLLLNVGYSDPTFLSAAVQGWRNVFDAAKPDCVVFDHSPTAMLAARGLNVPMFTIGTGFCCPVDQFPQPPMAPWRQMSEEQCIRDETKLVDHINQVLSKNSQRQIDRIGQIYSEVEENLLTTFRELDHFPFRRDGEYLGAWSRTSGDAIRRTAEVQWPLGTGTRIYAYLKPGMYVPELLRWISEHHFPALIVGDGISLQELQSHSGSNMHVSQEPLDLKSIAQSCDLAILNGNHGTTSEFLLAGVPILQIPLNFEQVILSRRTVELGAGLDAPPNHAQQVNQALRALLDSEQYRHGAQQFANNYATFDPANAIEDVTRRLLDKI